MQKNLATVRDSQGWADEQVALQYETISRQVQALTADLQQLVISLDQAGASNGITELVKGLRSIVQVLQQISPETLKLIGTTTAAIAALKALQSGFVTVNNYATSTTSKISMLGGVIGGFRGNVISGATALRLLSAGALSALFNLAALIPIIIAAASAIKSIEESRNAGYYAQQKMIEIDKQTQAYKDIALAIEKYQKVTNDSNTTDEQAAKAKDEYKQACESLGKVIGDEAYARVMASKDIKSAILMELEELERKRLANNASAKAALENEATSLEAVNQGVRGRIEMYGQEIIALENLIKARQTAYDSLMQSDAPDFIKKIGGYVFDNSTQGAKDDIAIYKQDIEKAKRELTNNEAKIIDIRKKITELAKPPEIKGGAMGTLEEPNAVGKDKNGGSIGNSDGSTDFTEKAKRNQYDRERNELWYQGKIAAQAYDNTLKEITNSEQLYGSTTTSILAKADVYQKYQKDLQEYQTQLQAFKDKLIADLDAQMLNNPELMVQVGYKTEATQDEKLKNIEINKELYQQIKTYSDLVNMVSSVNSKLEETKGKTLDISLNIAKVNDELSKQRIDNINKDAAINLSRINRPTNMNYEKQKNAIDLSTQRQLLEEYKNSIDTTKAKIKELTALNNEQYALQIEGLRNKLRTEVAEYENTNQKIAELEYQKNYDIRNGWADITQQFLIQGNSLRQIWNNLWQDLAREAIQRLFQVQAQASILSSIFGFFGGSSPMSFGTKNGVSGQFAANGDFISNKPVPKSHTGGLMGYPKMHTGGMVEKGRLGVVPKLQNDEVLRTLQVGEEVNSVSDRRSNEILAMVAMKAIDERSQQPNNVNIMALDSRSFAEYLNDNADTLMGVLAKQGALGRRS